MLDRFYCQSIIAIAALLCAFEGTSIWFWVLLSFGCIPLFISFRSRKSINIIFLSVVIFGIFYGYGTISYTETNLIGNESVFIGKVISEPSLTTTSRWSYQMKLSSGERLQVFLDNDKEPPLYGTTCYASGTLSKPHPATTPYTFNYLTYLKQQRIHWILQVSKINCNYDTRGLLNTMLSYRKKGIESLMKIGNEETSSLMTALVFGERSYISEERIGAYRKLGILHLLAVSGLHVGLVTFGVFYLLCRLGLTREKASILLMFLLPFYIIIAGGAPSVTRASIMCIVFLLFGLLHVKVSAMTILSFVCIGLLLFDPTLIYHLGFQLSFLTSFALLASNQLLRGKNKIMVMLKVTLVAQLISLPLSLFHFFEISLFTLPVNLLFIPFISLWYLPLSFLTVLLQVVFPLAAPLPYFLASESLKIMHLVMDLLMEFNGLMLVFGRPSSVLMVILFIGIFFFFYHAERKKGVGLILSGGILCLLLVLQLSIPYFRPYAVVTVLDVGQGDAIVIELPKRKGVYMIDTGGVIQWGNNSRISSGPGKRVIEPFLKGSGIAKIDRLILTHGHMDHIGEACFVTEKFFVKDVYYPVSDISESIVDKLGCVYLNSGSWNWVRVGDYWIDGGASFFVLNPSGDSIELNENDQSIVIKSEIEEVTFLFTGDLESAGEKRVMDMTLTNNIDVLKVGHHGSKTSTSYAFLDHWSPSIAVISAGKNNTFGHPHQEVLERLEERGIFVMRTDYHGTVQFILHNGNIEVTGHLR